MTSEEEADTAGYMVATKSVFRIELLNRGAAWATVIAAARGSARPVPPSVGAAKTVARTLLAAGESVRGRYSLRRWRRKQKDKRRISLGKQKGRQSLCVARVRENSENR